MGPSPVGLRLLDVGCGTGRRLRGSGASTAVGIDLTFEMVRQALNVRTSGAGFPSPEGAVRLPALAVADCRALPARADGFDLVWCRLMIGHVPDAQLVYAELGRVCAPGGTVVVTDLHPAAARAGHRRTFRDACGSLMEVRHHVHEVEDHLTWAHRAGLELSDRDDARVGPEIAHFYDGAGKRDLYLQQEGLPLVLVLSFRRPG